MARRTVSRTTPPDNYGIVSPSGSVYGLKVADWGNASAGGASPVAIQGTWDVLSSDKVDGANKTLTLTQNATLSQYCVLASAVAALVEPPRSIGFWVKNTTPQTVHVNLILWDSTKTRTHRVLSGVKSSPDWQFIICQEQQYYTSTLVAGDVISYVSASQFGAVANSWSAWPTGGQVLLGNVYINCRTRPKFIPRTDDGINSNVTNGVGFPTGYPASGGNYRDIISYYGYKGTLLLVPGWIGSTYAGTTYMTQAQIQSLLDLGWSAVNHSYTHPAGGPSGGSGLCLLGPRGYYYSQQTSAGYAYGPAADCPVTAATAATDQFSTGAVAHNMGVGFRLVFLDAAPTGTTLGTTYYVKTVPSGTTFTLSTNKDLTDTVNVTADWAGTTNFRYPGSTPDDTGIYNDIILARDTLNAMGFTGNTHFNDVLATPQGAWDPYLLSAAKRAGITTLWNTCSYNSGQHGIPIGNVIGGGNTGSSCSLDGSFALPGAVQVDGSPTLANIQAYMAQACRVGGTCSCVTHGIDAATATKYDGMLAYAKTLERQGVLDVVTFTEWLNGK